MIEVLTALHKHPNVANSNIFFTLHDEPYTLKLAKPAA